jgi:RNA polymerase sigma-70 factor (ECF subfamily)
VPGTEPGAGSFPSDGDSATDSSRVPTWEEIAKSHGRFLYTVAYRLTGDHEDARDLVQEVLLRVQRGLATYRPGTLEGWLSRITTNVFLDGVRQRKRRPTDLLPPEADLADRVLPKSRSASDELEAITLSADVQRALERLPDEFRAAIVLCDVAGLPYHEIADSLQIPIGTVRSRIHRGRALLREALAGREA